MSHSPQLQNALHDYQQFIRGLSAFRARNVAVTDPDPPVEPFVEVPRLQAVDVFLTRHLEYDEFREQLLDVRSKQEKFYFIEDRWQEAMRG